MPPDITHREALAAIAPEALARMKERSDRPGLARLAAHLGLLALTGAAVAASLGTWWLALPAMAVHGVVLVFLFAPLHETVHETAFRSPLANRIVAEICGFAILLPPRRFRYFHFAHHRHTQDEARDPELATPKPQGWPAYLWRLTGIAYWRDQAAALLSAAAGRPLPDYVPPSGRPRVVREARIHLAAYGAIAALCLATGWTAPLWFWIVPVLLGQPALRAYLLAEHTACPLVPDILANTRTTFTAPAIRFLAWNMPHHTAHHALPAVPFHQLPGLSAELRTNLKTTANGYPDAHRQIVAAFAPGS
ncbi:fatty acid desaturase [Kaustia mangrovi]|uniref:Fatty acid desaturase n=1 Tax=Kaustia mangrovi TaxID=2593653 RepID=A0A7S8HDT7_9HYPH|nr:fatty acid desaturase [Kaustia mangrovi]QPC45001.1 fatty acid desaturase [Kaustia mangrovi]